MFQNIPLEMSWQNQTSTNSTFSNPSTEKSDLIKKTASEEEIVEEIYQPNEEEYASFHEEEEEEEKSWKR